MNTKHLTFLVPGLFAAAVFVLAVSVGAQTPSPPATAPAAKSPQGAPMTGHHKDSAARAKHHADMKTECQGMMVKKQEMQDKLQAMDATLDNLVAEMNAAKADAMEKPMAAVINELVAQRKALRSMMMEMQPPMMAHMIHHMHMRGTKGAMECPMMKTGNAPEPKAEEKKPQM